MTNKEIRGLLGIIKLAYPNSFKDMQLADRNALVMLWERQFGDMEYSIVSKAIDAIIATDTSGFMPSIGRIKQEIIRLTQPPLLSEQEAWNLVKKAINGASVSPSSVIIRDGQTDGKTSARRNFEKLPEELQRIVGSPNQLAEWANMDAQTLDAVVASNFMRSYKVRAKNDRDYLALPSDVRALAESTAKEMLMIESTGY